MVLSIFAGCFATSAVLGFTIGFGLVIALIFGGTCAAGIVGTGYEISKASRPQYNVQQSV